MLRVIRRLREEIRSPGDGWTATRVTAWAALIRLTKYALPLPRLVRLVAAPARGGPRDWQREQRLVVYARWAARLVRPRDEGSCLERSLVLYRFLALANAEPSLVVGFRSHEDRVGGHVWVVVDGHVVGEPVAAIAGYQVAMRFGPGGLPVAA